MCIGHTRRVKFLSQPLGGLHCLLFEGVLLVELRTEVQRSKKMYRRRYHPYSIRYDHVYSTALSRMPIFTVP